jgi:hypothetical protein
MIFSGINQNAAGPTRCESACLPRATNSLSASPYLHPCATASPHLPGRRGPAAQDHVTTKASRTLPACPSATEGGASESRTLPIGFSAAVGGARASRALPVCSSDASPTRHTWDPIPLPTPEQDSRVSASVSRSNSEPGTGVARDDSGRSDDLSINNSTAHEQSELLRLIARLTSVATAHSPVATPTSKPASPQHTYTALRSSSKAPPTDQSDSITCLKTPYVADHPATPTGERKRQTETPTWKSKLDADQSGTMDDDLDDESHADPELYVENPASQTFVKTAPGCESKARPRESNVYERSLSSPGFHSQAGRLAATVTRCGDSAWTGEGDIKEDAPVLPPPSLCRKWPQGGSTGSSTQPDSYLHAIAPSVFSDNSLDEEGYLRPEKLN